MLRKLGWLKNVQRCCVELKRHVLTEFNGFERGDVADAR